MKNSLHRIFWFWLPPSGYMIAIFFMSSQSDPQIGIETPDYVLHSFGYFVLTLLLIRLFLAEQPRILVKLTTFFSGFRNGSNSFLFWNIAGLSGVLIAILYGISDEIHQYFIPGRHCSFADLIADAFGAFMAYGISMLDYWLVSRTSFHTRIIGRMKFLKAISYAGYLSSKPSDPVAGYRLSME